MLVPNSSSHVPQSRKSMVLFFYAAMQSPKRSEHCGLQRRSLLRKQLGIFVYLFIPLSHIQDTGPNEGGSHEHPATSRSHPINDIN